MAAKEAASCNSVCLPRHFVDGRAMRRTIRRASRSAGSALPFAIAKRSGVSCLSVLADRLAPRSTSRCARPNDCLVVPAAQAPLRRRRVVCRRGEHCARDLPVLTSCPWQRRLELVHSILNAVVEKRPRHSIRARARAQGADSTLLSRPRPKGSGSYPSSSMIISATMGSTLLGIRSMMPRAAACSRACSRRKPCLGNIAALARTACSDTKNSLCASSSRMSTDFHWRQPLPLRRARV